MLSNILDKVRQLTGAAAARVTPETYQAWQEWKKEGKLNPLQKRCREGQLTQREATAVQNLLCKNLETSEPLTWDMLEGLLFMDSLQKGGYPLEPALVGHLQGLMRRLGNYYLQSGGYHLWGKNEGKNKASYQKHWGNDRLRLLEDFFHAHPNLGGVFLLYADQNLQEEHDNPLEGRHPFIPKLAATGSKAQKNSQLRNMLEKYGDTRTITFLLVHTDPQRESFLSGLEEVIDKSQRQEGGWTEALREILEHLDPQQQQIVHSKMGEKLLAHHDQQVRQWGIRMAGREGPRTTQSPRSRGQ